MVESVTQILARRMSSDASRTGVNRFDHGVGGLPNERSSPMPEVGTHVEVSAPAATT